MPEIRPSLTDPGIMIATVGGIGWLPWAPGTWGSLAAVPVGWILIEAGGAVTLVVCCAGLFLLGMWACDRHAAITGTHDSGACVIDEVAGQWVVLLATPLDPAAYAAAFIVFRLLDILKPWPANWADRSVGGGFGVMLDDLIAGLQGAAIMLIGTAVFSALA